MPRDGSYASVGLVYPEYVDSVVVDCACSPKCA
jgi:hypothetical protein